LLKFRSAGNGTFNEAHGLLRASAMAAALASTAPAQASTIVDTGAPPVGPGWSVLSIQYFVGEFTLLERTMLTSVKGYFDTFNGPARR
jgi:hypothetical protein